MEQEVKLCDEVETVMEIIYPGDRVSQRKKGMPKRTWKKQVKEESVKVGLRREDSLC